MAKRIGSRIFNYFLGDNLGSQAITTDSSDPLPPPPFENTQMGEETSNYYPWGTERYTSGTTPTTFHFTGQRLESAIGLYYYGARWYDPALGRFVQADTIVPDMNNSQAYDRYVYVYNNPLRYIDPSGHFTEEEICKYWGYCDEKSARIGLGDELFNIIWKTKITLGGYYTTRR